METTGTGPPNGPSGSPLGSAPSHPHLPTQRCSLPQLIGLSPDRKAADSGGPRPLSRAATPLSCPRPAWNAQAGMLHTRNAHNHGSTPESQLPPLPHRHIQLNASVPAAPGPDPQGVRNRLSPDHRRRLKHSPRTWWPLLCSLHNEKPRLREPVHLPKAGTRREAEEPGLRPARDR